MFNKNDGSNEHDTAHQTAICTQAVDDHSFRICREFYITGFVKTDRCFTKPNTSFLIEIVIFEAVQIIVYDDILMDCQLYHMEIILDQPLLFLIHADVIHTVLHPFTFRFFLRYQAAIC